MSIKMARWPFAALILGCLLTFPAAAQQTPAPTNVDSQSSSEDDQPAPQQDSPKQAGTQQQAPQTGSNTQGQSNSGSSTPGSGSSTPGASNPPNANSGNQSGQGKVAGTSNDRLFYTLPNFLSLQNGAKLPPLTTKEKFKVVALGTFDPVQYPWWGLLAAISQGEDSEPAFGQGWAAYGKRYGTTAGDSMVENFMVGAVFPSILHQDPRFYQSEKGGYAQRTWYAVTRILVTRGDSGNKQFNFSEVFGAAFAAAVSTYSYHPKSTYISTPTNPHMFVASERTLTNTATVWGTQMGLDTITIVVKEFWPDIHRKLSHKHQGAMAKTDKSSQ
ncbi:MAG: hypothetical protein WBD59_12680 [Candidatus Sulfotelmatobacter sp.]